MFIEMNTIYFLVVLAVLVIAFAFSMGYEIWRDSYEMQVQRTTDSKALSDDLHQQLVDALKWKYAVQDALLLLHTSWSEDAQDAQRDLSLLIETEISMALDPRISQGAARLVTKAKREHGKKIRAQADRKLTKAVTEQKRVTAAKQTELDQWKRQAGLAEEHKQLARAELHRFQGALMDVLEAKIKLPTVRQSLVDELNRRHTEIQLALKE